MVHTKNEVKLCGHATLAAAFVIFNYLDTQAKAITFQSKSGPLYVKKCDNERIQLNFPAIYPERIDLLPNLVEALGSKPKAIYQSKQDYLVVYENQECISSLTPDLDQLINLDLRGVIVSSEGNGEHDFVSRFLYLNVVSLKTLSLVQHIAFSSLLENATQ